MASALQPEIWRPNMPGVRELITYSSSGLEALVVIMSF